jgi:hypothetical protein
MIAETPGDDAPVQGNNYLRESVPHAERPHHNFIRAFHHDP